MKAVNGLDGVAQKAVSIGGMETGGQGLDQANFPTWTIMVLMKKKGNLFLKDKIKNTGMLDSFNEYFGL